MDSETVTVPVPQNALDQEVTEPVGEEPQASRDFAARRPPTLAEGDQTGFRVTTHPRKRRRWCTSGRIGALMGFLALIAATYMALVAWYTYKITILSACASAKETLGHSRVCQRFLAVGMDGMVMPSTPEAQATPVSIRRPQVPSDGVRKQGDWPILYGDLPDMAPPDPGRGNDTHGTKRGLFRDSWAGMTTIERERREVLIAQLGQTLVPGAVKEYWDAMKHLYLKYGVSFAKIGLLCTSTGMTWYINFGGRLWTEVSLRSRGYNSNGQRRRRVPSLRLGTDLVFLGLAVAHFSLPTPAHDGRSDAYKLALLCCQYIAPAVAVSHGRVARSAIASVAPDMTVLIAHTCLLAYPLKGPSRFGYVSEPAVVFVYLGVTPFCVHIYSLCRATLLKRMKVFGHIEE